MNVKITNYLSSAVFLNLIANMVVGQSMVAPIRVADLNPTGASSPRSFTVGGAAADRLYFEWDNAITGGSLRRVYISSYDAGIDLVTKVSDWDDYTWIVATGPSIVYYTVSRGSLYYFTEIFWKGLDGSSGGYIFYRNFEKIRAENGVVKAGKLISNGSSPQTALNKGDEVYSVDPATSSATLLRDIAPGTASSTPTGFLTHNGAVYFTATNATSGTELYTTDGTPAGTLMMKDIVAGSLGGDPQDMRSVAGRLYFSALVATGNREPWSCNGTTASTVKLKEINPSTTVGSDLKEFTALGTKVFFSADNGSNGRELWMTDGTANGTVLVKDIAGGSTGSDPHELIHFNKKVWFVASEGLGRTRSLFATDGTAAGTLKMLSLPVDSDGENLRVCNGKLFYVTRTSSTTRMWCTDGTAQGTKQVQPAISPNINPIGSAPMAVMGNWLYFNGNFDATGSELWKVQ